MHENKDLSPYPIFTIGHSTRPLEEFLRLLKAQAITMLVDIRTVPRSRYNPQYNTEALAQSLSEAGISYRHEKALGGLRHARKDSPNGGWRNASFRGYADHMQSIEFVQALEYIIALSAHERIALMCAESVPWRCHRSLVADALTARHISVAHIMAENKATPHQMTSFAQVKGQQVSYPPPDDLFSAVLE